MCGDFEDHEEILTILIRFRRFWWDFEDSVEISKILMWLWRFGGDFDYILRLDSQDCDEIPKIHLRFIWDSSEINPYGRMGLWF